MFHLFSGKSLTGIVIHETADELHLVIDPLNQEKPTVILKEDVVERIRSDVSQMPTGLLDKLSREEILDLIAYVYAGGDKTHELYQGVHHHH